MLGFIQWPNADRQDPLRSGCNTMTMTEETRGFTRHSLAPSSRGLELWDEKKRMKVARFMPHVVSGGEPELMMSLPMRNPEEDCFVDMVALMVMAVLVTARGSMKIASSTVSALLGLGP